MKMNPLIRSVCTLVLGGWIFATQPATAEIIEGVDFPQGVRSFADEVVSFTNGSPASAAAYAIAAHALGTPDYGGQTCASNNCSYVSLGSGGVLTMRFTDNLLTGSGTTNFDLWIFEVGPNAEDTFVEISRDGSTWLSVGTAIGGHRGIDIDAFGYGPGDSFAFVRLTDDPNEGANSGSPTVGADIDAVGAITTTPPPSIKIQCANLLCTNAQICWPTISNLSYQVEYRTDLNTNLWTLLGEPIVGNGATNCIFDSILAQPKRFYRLNVGTAP